MANGNGGRFVSYKILIGILISMVGVIGAAGAITYSAHAKLPRHAGAMDRETLTVWLEAVDQRLTRIENLLDRGPLP